MKIDPIQIILNKNFKFDKKFYFISGNEITLIEKIKQTIVNYYNKDKLTNYEKLKDISLYKNDVGLFESYKVYLISDVKNLSNDKLDEFSNKDDVFIFCIENSPKIKQVKNIFIKRADCLLVDCYELTKDIKNTILNNYLDENKIKLEKSAYWSVLDKLDNKYVFLENELKKLKGVENKLIDINVVDRLLSKNNSGLEKIFFEVLNDNQRLINIYNNRVKNQKEVSEFYYSFRQFCNLIINYDEINEFSKNIPKYLFREKTFLLNIFKMYNSKKKKLLLKLMLRTERGIRLSGSLSVIIGLRFLLGFRKITIS